jgi:hypothetical protein
MSHTRLQSPTWMVWRGKSAVPGTTGAMCATIGHGREWGRDPWNACVEIWAVPYILDHLEGFRGGDTPFLV